MGSVGGARFSIMREHGQVTRDMKKGFEDNEVPLTEYCSADEIVFGMVVADPGWKQAFPSEKSEGAKHLPNELRAIIFLSEFTIAPAKNNGQAQEPKLASYAKRLN